MTELKGPKRLKFLNHFAFDYGLAHGPRPMQMTPIVPLNETEGCLCSCFCVQLSAEMDCIPNQDPLCPQSSIGASLEDRELWLQFHQEGTEMIITKSGRRMFPQCKIRLFGLNPYAKYVVLVDFVPLDNFRYKWNKSQWEVAGKAEPPAPCRSYIHPDSPAQGAHWMKDVICFQKFKLTNNTLDQQGHIILHSMHRYKPRFHVIQSDDLYSQRWALLQLFSFPETEFTAVTAYQNEKITKLKIDHNPFAKGFREQERAHRRDDSSKMTPSRPAKQQKRKWEDTVAVETADQAKVLDSKEETSMVPSGAYHWIHEEGTSILTPSSPELTDSTNQEQQVPCSSSSLVYRSHPREGSVVPFSHSDMGDIPGRRLTPDVATVPECNSSQQPLFRTAPSSHDRSCSINFSIDTTGKPALCPNVCNPYGADQWMIPSPAPYRPMGYSSYPTDFNTQGAVSNPHGAMSDWSQYSLFPYAPW
ncbi:T-box protein VegT-like [Pelodytes ibericus]